MEYQYLTADDFRWIDENVKAQITSGKKTYTHTLNDVEQTITKRMALLRQQAARSAGHTNTPYGQTQDKIDINGYGAELAFCKLFNIYPDFTHTARVGGYDCIGHKGVKIDVKNTTYKDGHLLVKRSKDSIITGVDMYALMVGDFPTYTFVGYAFKEDVFKQENLKTLGNYNSPGYALTQEQLRHF